jgi:hypothetical protein
MTQNPRNSDEDKDHGHLDHEKETEPSSLHEDSTRSSQDKEEERSATSSTGASPESEALTFGLSDEALQAELHSYAAALRQEFELTTNSKTAHPDDTANVEKYTRDFFKKNLAHAAAQVVWLSSNSDSDSIRLKASMFIIKEALAASREEGDPISELLKSLKSPTEPLTS